MSLVVEKKNPIRFYAHPSISNQLRRARRPHEPDGAADLPKDGGDAVFSTLIYEAAFEHSFL